MSGYMFELSNDILTDKRLLSLPPSDRWMFISFVSEWERYGYRKGVHQVADDLGISGIEILKVIKRFMKAGLLDEFFNQLDPVLVRV